MQKHSDSQKSNFDVSGLNEYKKLMMCDATSNLQSFGGFANLRDNFSSMHH